MFGDLELIIIGLKRLPNKIIINSDIKVIFIYTSLTI